MNKIFPSLINKYERSRNQVTQTEEQFVSLCNQILDILTELKQHIQEEKDVEDGASIIFSGIGSVSSIVTVVSLFNPVAWPIAVAGLSVSIVSGKLSSL